ncbi:MAG: nuclear transport factor 2 family protein [Acidobacteriota bacterium]
MKKKLILFVIFVIIMVFFTANLSPDCIADVKSVIEKSYFNGSFNELDTKSMAKGFHPEFAIFSAKGEKIGRYPIDVWIKGIEKRKADPDFDKSKVKMDCKIVNLDVTGGCASAKVTIARNGKVIYTDYLSLLKFKDGWKIVAKVYHKHKK